jgi:RHS repeat-associated protein
VINHYPNESVPSLAVGGEVAVVNRSESYLGAGWFLSGVERIHCVDCSTGGSRFLWVGADGSTRVYEPPVNGSWTYWVATHPDRRRDTLKLVGSEYHLRTPAGDSVYFNGAGLHIRTVNRLGQATQFTWGPLGLEAVHAPGGGPGTGPSWTLAWDYPAGLVQTISAVAPGAPTRTTHLTFGTRRRTTAITDPDSGSVQFAYPDSQTLINRHRDRRGTYVYFGYNGYRKLIASRLQMGASPNDSVDAVLTYTPVEVQGLALDGATAGSPVLTVRAYTRIDGPRGDVADQVLVWHSPRGAVSRVRDPLGAETHLEYANPLFPTLPTRMAADGAPTVNVQYDARGRVDKVTTLNVLDDGRDLVTAYGYDDLWDAPDTVRSYERTGSGPLVALAGGAAYAAYDSQTGNVLWRQQGDDPARRVTFGYVASGSARGLPLWVRRPSGVPGQTARDSLVYDANGNLSRTVSPLGFLTLHYRDALGRDTLTVSPTTAVGAVTEAGVLATGVRRRVTYSIMDRVTHTMRIGPALTQDGAIGYIPTTTGADTLTVETTFDAGGLPLVVARYASPDTAHVATVATTYTYDAAGRVKTETHGLVQRRYEYDLAGNVVAMVTPRGHRITSTYDAGGRLVRRVVPGVSYPRECPSSTSPCVHSYPYHPTAGGGALAIPEEWTDLRYDAAGRLAWTANRDTVVWRSFFPNGALQTDSISLRSLQGTEFAPEHRYGIAYGYRVGGQVSSVQHPSLAGPQNTDLFTHDAATGAVASMTSRLGHVFEFKRNAAGQLTSLRAPGYTDSTVYDLGGRVVRRLELGATGDVVDLDSLVYDARGKVIDVYANGQSRARQWYSGSGMLVGTNWQNTYNPAVQQEAFGMDAMGNMSWRRSGNGGTTPQFNVHQYTYHPTLAAVTVVELTNLNDPMSGYLPERSTREYDAAGNVTWSVFEAMGELGNGTIGPIRDQRGRSYYDAADRIRYYHEQDLRGGLTIDVQGVFEEYRYDPLGRRVLVDTRTKEICTSNAFRCTSATTRFVWAGSHLLWEIKRYSESPGETAGEAGAYGTVGYTHGGGIDRPLVITKNGQSVLPHMNWRGEFARGTYPSGASSDCPVGSTTNCTLIAWPGWRTTAWYRDPSEPDIRTWWGSLSTGKYDASGRTYMRNREYDPATGQFTQMDPIGLAGGLSSYGFAGGDPVNNFDPFGTQVECKMEGDQEVCPVKLDAMTVVASPRGRAPAPVRHFVEGVGSYFRGGYRFVRHVGRQSGLMGECEYQRTWTEDRMLVEAAEYLRTPEGAKVAYEAGMSYLSNNKARVAGRLTTGLVVTKLTNGAGIFVSAMAIFGDIRYSAERGRGTLEELADAAVGGDVGSALHPACARS